MFIGYMTSPSSVTWNCTWIDVGYGKWNSVSVGASSVRDWTEGPIYGIYIATRYEGMIYIDSVSIQSDAPVYEDFSYDMSETDGFVYSGWHGYGDLKNGTASAVAEHQGKQNVLYVTPNDTFTENSTQTYGGGFCAVFANSVTVKENSEFTVTYFIPKMERQNYFVFGVRTAGGSLQLSGDWHTIQHSEVGTWYTFTYNVADSKAPAGTEITGVFFGLWYPDDIYYDEVTFLSDPQA